MKAHDLSKLSTDILIRKLLIHELTLKHRKEEKVEKEEKKKRIDLEPIQDDNEEESLKDSSDDEDEIAMITRGFKKFHRKRNFLR